MRASHINRTVRSRNMDPLPPGDRLDTLIEKRKPSHG